MRVSQAYNEVREVVGPNVSEVVISRALKDNAYSVAGAINQIVDLTSAKSVISYRTQQKGNVEVVDLLDEEEEEVHAASGSAVKVVDSSSKRFRESPPTVLGAPFAKSASLLSSSSSLSVPKSSQTTIWPKVLGRRSVDAESTYRGRPPPEMVAGSQLKIKRVANSTQKNKIVRLTTSLGTEIGRLPSALADLLAPLLDAGCISCRVRVEFLPERLEIFTRFCVTIEFCVNNSDAFKCFEIAEAGESGDDPDSGSKRKRGFALDDDDLADKFWKIIQLSFGTLTVDGVYKERLVKGAISLLEDDQFDARTQSDAPPKELSEDELFGNGKNAKLSDTAENDDSEVQSGLTVTLRSHQRIAVNWMKKREEGTMKSTTSLSHHPLWTEVKFEDGSSFYLNRFTRMATVVPPPNVSHLCKGGILADEMGLGKTIVVLGRVTQDINEAKQQEGESKLGKDEELEVDKENDTEECGTLVIVVTSLLSQWEDEIDTKVNSDQPGRRTSRFSRFTYYGSDRDASSRLRTADVVLTTFGVVAAEHKSGNTTLFDIKWRRVVLDEAQSVRNADTLQAKAVLDLQADRRWCLSGTPVQNGIDDLFQLFRFIRLEPWGQRLWWDRVIEKPYKAGNPAALQRIRSVLADGPVLLRRTHKSIQEAGREDKSHELPPLKTEIVYLDLSPAERAFYDSLYNRSKLEFDGMVASGKAATSYVTILSLLIRLRQAADHPFLVLGRPKSDKDEEKKRDDEYIRRISAKYFSTVDKAVSPEQTGSAASSGFVMKTLRDLATNGGDCTICLCPMTDPVLLKCAHAFCRKCILDLKGNYYGGDQCPICRESFEKSDLVDIRLPSRENQISLKDGTLVTDSDELLGERFRSSSKLDRLVSEIQTRRQENGRKDKFLIFSQFTQMLDLCQVALSRMDPPVAFQRLDGSMCSSKRDQALKSFRDDSTVEALVMSLKAGCLGLNITCANVVILLDPWWNAAVEHQAIGRAHRMGQTREVNVLRFIANNTVEVKMLAVQERKKSVASDTLGFDQFAVGGDDDEAKASSKLTLEDLREFFS